MPAETINTGGGSTVGGSVTAHNFVGRDLIVQVNGDAESLRQTLQVFVNNQAALTQKIPEAAFVELLAAIDEIAKLYLLIDTEVTNYVSMYFDPQQAVAPQRAPLLAFEGGKVIVRASEARGHCHKISMIYRSRLQAWFAKQLPADAGKVDDTFRRLSESDGYMADTIQNLARVLQREADSTLALVDAQKLAEANAQVQQARIAFRPLRNAIPALLVEMRKLQDAMLDASLATDT